MSSTNSSSPRRSKLILGLIFALLCARLLVLKSDYDRVIGSPMFTTQEAGIEYSVWRGPGPGTLHIGDLLGTNIKSAGFLASFRPAPGHQTIVVPSLHPVAFQEVTPESLLDIVANRRDIVLVDNFCRRDWDKVAGRAWYKNTSLSPGPYCLSEPETRLMDRLIKQYQVTRVIIYADHKMYVHMIDTFLKYLEEIHVAYTITEAP